MKKQICQLSALVLTAAVLCGCQGAPVREAPPETVLQETTAPTETAAPASGDFTSADGSLEFHMDFEPMATQELTTVAVAPRFLTGTDARRVAELLLPGAEFYEQERESERRYSKEEAQRKLELYAHLPEGMDLEANYGMDSNGRDISRREAVEMTVAFWQDRLAAAEEDPHTPCDWKLKNGAHYYDHETGAGNDTLMAMAAWGELDYSLSLVSSSREDRKISRICLGLSEGSALEKELNEARLCTGEAPTDQQLADLGARAQSLLDQMELGTWQVTGTEVELRHRGSETAYTVVISAHPVLDGIPVVKAQKPGREDNYGMSEAGFRFSARGDLLGFELNAPIEVQPGDQTVAMPGEKLLEKIRAQLAASDISADYGAPGDFCRRRAEKLGEPLRGVLAFTRAQAAMGRMGTDGGYVYIPVLCLSGTADYFGAESGRRSFGTGDPFGAREQPLVWVNMLDGTLIHPENK